MAYENVIAAIEQALAEQQLPGDVEAAVQSGVPISRFVAGITNVEQLVGELSALGYKGIRQTRLVLAAQLKRELELFLDRLVLRRQQLKDGKITLSQFTSWLELSGIDAEGVALEVARAEAKPPAKVIQSVQVALRMAEVAEVPARPVEQPLTLGIRIVQAETMLVAPTVGVQSLALTLRLTELEEVEEVPVKTPVLYFDIIKIEEVPYGSQSIP